VEVLRDTEVRQVLGTDRLEGVMVENTRTAETRTLETPALFSFIGAVPRTGWLPPQIETDPKGFIRTGRLVTDSPRWTLRREPYLLETSHPGVFAAGDVRLGAVPRVASAVGVHRGDQLLDAQSEAHGHHRLTDDVARVRRYDVLLLAERLHDLECGPAARRTPLPARSAPEREHFASRWNRTLKSSSRSSDTMIPAALVIQDQRPWRRSASVWRSSSRLAQFTRRCAV
jgi:hypothetical protein